VATELRQRTPEDQIAYLQDQLVRYAGELHESEQARTLLHQEALNQGAALARVLLLCQSGSSMAPVPRESILHAVYGEDLPEPGPVELVLHQIAWNHAARCHAGAADAVLRELEEIGDALADALGVAAPDWEHAREAAGIVPDEQLFDLAGDGRG
jgi:hypothetical protein